MDFGLNECVRARLKAEETMLWAGQPVAARSSRPALMLAAAAVLALLLYWSRGPTARIGLGALAVVAMLAALRAWRRALRTFYIVTDQRLARFRFGRRVKELNVSPADAQGGRLRMHSDGTADAVLGNGIEFTGIADPQVFAAALAQQPPPEPDKDPEKLPVPEWVARAVAAVVCCLCWPFVWYALAVLGLVLLWYRSGLGTGWRVAVTALALLPQVLPEVLSRLTGPGDLAFPLETRTLAASSTSWGWLVLLWAAGGLLLMVLRGQGRAMLAAARIQLKKLPATGPENKHTILCVAVVAVVAWATISVLGLNNDFEWVEAAAPGAWRLKHTIRGTVATFSPEVVERIECVVAKPDPETPSHRVRVGLKSGVTRQLTTKSPMLFDELKKLAAAMELPAGRMRLSPAGAEPWSNGQFVLSRCAGIYESPGGGSLELRLENGRLTGAETLAGAGGMRITRALRRIKVTEEGAIEYTADAVGGWTGLFSMGWGTARGSFAGDGIEIGGKRYVKRVTP